MKKSEKKIAFTRASKKSKYLRKKEDYFGKEKDQREGVSKKDRVVRAEYGQSALYTCMKCGNATHCFVQLIDANKNAKIELHNLFSNAKESNLTI
jgi:hypothetical protein